MRPGFLLRPRRPPVSRDERKEAEGFQKSNLALPIMNPSPAHSSSEYRNRRNGSGLAPCFETNG